ncbi:outer envelope pore protein 24B, chloroplastic-like [Solanum dulcamara]|uniref:outer envelope pore protein 24B, chloroplastic-like n=1 Tax=Solanum dulcamara TaxID=45834 RepID=UPI00248508D7|nr:outer envelope pore protein 24B, chloroplastic-like [Solanum dulcamara]
MMKATVKAQYETEKEAPTGGATVAFKAGDLKLRASMTDVTLLNGPSFKGLAVAVEKPGSFIFDYNVPKNDFTFQFMNSIKVLEKPLNLTYSHSVGENKTILDGTLVFDSANKLSVNHKLGSEGCKLKYSYVHGGLTTFEPSYDTQEDSWDFAVSHGKDVCSATYKTPSKNLGLQWSRSSKLGASFKVSASLCVDDEELFKFPKLTAETSWDFEI